MQSSVRWSHISLKIVAGLPTTVCAVRMYDVTKNVSRRQCSLKLIFCADWVGLGACKGIAEFAGLENDGVEQEEMYILHTMK